MEKRERKGVAEEGCSYVTDERQLTVGLQGKFLNFNLVHVRVC